jgi:L-ascorbate metabolism protein UlaG (beta-lactamase superfamily)
MAFSLPTGMQVTWLGHSCFHVVTPTGKNLLFDPFLTGNPSTPADKKEVAAVDLLLVTHGHSDHTGDAAAIAKKTGCPVVGMVELTAWLGRRGVDGGQLHGMNKGGSLHFPDLGLTVTVTHAFHSSSAEEDGALVYTGEPAGFVVTLDSGTAFYFAGDTDVFGDMALISELYAPSLAFLPIGDHFTMGPRGAAKAVTLLPSVQAVVPMHYGTFGLLTGTPEAFAEAVKKAGGTAEVKVLRPGEAWG